MSWMADMGYHEATEPPSAHQRHCRRAHLMVAQGDDTAASIFVYCDRCGTVWRVGVLASGKMRSEQFIKAAAERKYRKVQA